MDTFDMGTLLAALSMLAYFGAAGLIARRTVAAVEPRADSTPTTPPGVSLVALAFHAALLYWRVWRQDGVALGLIDAASLVCWVAALALFLVALTRPLTNIGLLIFPICAVVIGLSAVVTGARPQSDPGNLGFQTHVMTSVIAYGVLLLAVCQSLVLAFQEARLAAHRPGALLGRLPPLTTQETLLFQLLAVGFFCLSLSLASGLVFVEDLMAQHLAHKTVLAFIAWAVFAALLWGRWRRGWRGRMAVRLVLAGFGLLVLAYFGSKLVLEVVLERPWFAS